MKNFEITNQCPYDVGNEHIKFTRDENVLFN
jgi:hypothetical protein